MTGNLWIKWETKASFLCEFHLSDSSLMFIICKNEFKLNRSYKKTKVRDMEYHVMIFYDWENDKSNID